jgi:hypothetical protein
LLDHRQDGDLDIDIALCGPDLDPAARNSALWQSDKIAFPKACAKPEGHRHSKVSPSRRPRGLPHRQALMFGPWPVQRGCLPVALHFSDIHRRIVVHQAKLDRELEQ